jgi:hypothetical protein
VVPQLGTLHPVRYGLLLDDLSLSSSPQKKKEKQNRKKSVVVELTWIHFAGNEKNIINQLSGKRKENQYQDDSRDQPSLEKALTRSWDRDTKS